MPPEELARDFANYACDKLERNLSQISRCAGLLSVEQLWWRANENCNAVGNLIIHLTGNVSQWITGGVAGRQVQRARAAEFAQRDPLPRDDIVARLDAAVHEGVRVIRECGPERLAERRWIQSYDVTVQAAIFHVVEHFSWHTGQIVHMTKAMLDVDLSMYDEQGRAISPAPGNRP